MVTKGSVVLHTANIESNNVYDLDICDWSEIISALFALKSNDAPDETNVVIVEIRAIVIRILINLILLSTK